MRICMVAYSFYENDNRVRRYAESLVRRGDQVDALAVGLPGQPRTEVIEGVRVIRLQSRVRNEGGPLSYLFRMLLVLLPLGVVPCRAAVPPALRADPRAQPAGFRSVRHTGSAADGRARDPRHA